MLDLIFLFLPAVITLFQQHLEAAPDHRAMNNQQCANGDHCQQHRNQHDSQKVCFTVADNVAGKERYHRNNAQYDSDDQLPCIGGLEFLFAVTHHAVHAVKGVDRVLLQILKARSADAAGHEQRHRTANEKKQHYKSDAYRLKLCDFESLHRLRAGEQDQKDRRQDTEHDAERDAPGTLLLDAKESVGFLHADRFIYREIGLHFRRIYRFQLVLQ